MKTLPDSVKQLKDWPISGHLIPHTWYHHLTTKRGDPYGPAIFILADILYWYRPKVITDEKTGKVTYEKKFKKDLLQRSYEQMASKFSISKRQATQAVVYLEEKNLIKRVFRSIKLGDLVINNVLYIELNVEELFKISLPEDEIIDPLPSHRETLSHPNEGDSLSIKGDPLPLHRETNTKTTSQTTFKRTDKNTSSTKSSEEKELF